MWWTGEMAKTVGDEAGYMGDRKTAEYSGTEWTTVEGTEDREGQRKATEGRRRRARSGRPGERGRPRKPVEACRRL